MKKVIPEVVEHYCDRCEKKVDNNSIDSKGNATFIGRDLQGHSVGAQNIEFELCSSCTKDLDKFFGENRIYNKLIR